MGRDTLHIHLARLVSRFVRDRVVGATWRPSSQTGEGRLFGCGFHAALTVYWRRQPVCVDGSGAYPTVAKTLLAWSWPLALEQQSIFVLVL